MKEMQRIVLLVLTLTVLIGIIPTVDIEANEVDSSNNSSFFSSSYIDYNAKYLDEEYPDNEIVVSGSDSFAGADTQATVGEYEGRSDCLIWESGHGKVDFSVNVSAAGRYFLEINYYSISGKGGALEYAMLIDDTRCFKEMSSISLPRYYKYSNDVFSRDINDNELRPEHIDVPMWISYTLTDDKGMYNEPYSFYFSEGNHRISFEALRDGIVISSIRLYQLEKILPYNEYIEQVKGDDIDGDTIIIEAEKPFLKSSNTLYPISDRTDPATSLSDPVKTRLNTIGGDNWCSKNQQIIWKFNAPKSGYYKFGFRYKQNYLRSMPTYREIKIDGKIPFDELSVVDFPYTSSWNVADTGEYRIYLEKGPHTIMMSPTLGTTSEIVLRTSECLEVLNDLYSQIITITGTTPDMWRDYYLHEAIPGLKDGFKYAYEELVGISDYMFELTGKEGSEAALIVRICKQLKKFIKSQDAIAEQLESFHSNLSSLSSWVLNLCDQKLLLDTIYITPYNSSFPVSKASFWEKLAFHTKAFIGAFTEDYSAVGNLYSDKNGKKITVWTASGRDQAEIIKEMIDSVFVKQSGINVNLQLMQGTFETAVLSGRGPDVSLGGASPVSLALRDAVVPLDMFKDFEKVTERYYDTALDPFSIKGHCYALPESINFDMMFYRTDIFSRLGIEPPKTLDELYEIIEILHRNNMNVGLPADLFQVLVLQMGGRIYNNHLTSTELTSTTAYKAFQMWTDFYSQHGAPIVKDDYNRFRSGEMPLTIITYDFYMKLYASAPEIRNNWAMVPIPAFGDKNTAIITQTAACIYDAAKEKDASWEFLKWWTSEETQHAYSNKLESVFGIAGRYSPADPGAYSKVAWSGDEYKALSQQLENAVALPVVPGDYYVLRNITNAFESVLYNKKNTREALKYWTDQTDREIARRCEEFGVGEENTYYE